MKRTKRTREVLTIAFCCFCAAFLIFSALFLFSLHQAENEKDAFAELAEIVAVQPEEPDETSQEIPDEVPTELPAADNRERFAALLERNSDFVGWLSIEGTAVNYPVMCTPDDPEYYLKRDFDGNRSNSGVPFFGEGCDTESDNIIIYGHNMKNGTMFSSLTNYADESYYEEHPTISFDTPDGDGTYEIIAVFRECGCIASPKPMYSGITTTAGR